MFILVCKMHAIHRRIQQNKYQIGGLFITGTNLMFLNGALLFSSQWTLESEFVEWQSVPTFKVFSRCSYLETARYIQEKIG